MLGLKNYFLSAYLLLGFWLILIILLLFFIGLGNRNYAGDPRLSGEQNLVRMLRLTDFCLATESRHTRHISLPEPIAPFQDMPGYLDHFPTSTFFWPPPQARVWNNLGNRENKIQRKK